MNTIRQIQELNKRELEAGITPEGSWHADYRDTAYIFVGGLPFELSEGDIITIFSQYGEPVFINLVRDKETGKSKGFAFLRYEDQRSTDLAVDNLGGAVVLGRTLRVDHTRYKKKDDEDLGDNTMSNIPPACRDGEDFERDRRSRRKDRRRDYSEDRSRSPERRRIKERRRSKERKRSKDRRRDRNNREDRGSDREERKRRSRHARDESEDEEDRRKSHRRHRRDDSEDRVVRKERRHRDRSHSGERSRRSRRERDEGNRRERDRSPS